MPLADMIVPELITKDGGIRMKTNYSKVYAGCSNG